MAMGRLRRGLLLLAVLVSINGAAIASSLIINGSFEQGPAVGAFANLPAGTTSIMGWVVTGEGIDYVSSLWGASDGARSLDLDGSSSSAKTPPYAQGGIAQTFATTPGTRYVVTFDMAGNPYGGPIQKPMRVSAAGQEMNFTFDITGKNASNMGWVSKSWTFTANAASTTLEFRSLTVSPATGFAAVIDNVSVTAQDGAAQPVSTKIQKEVQTNQKATPPQQAQGLNPPYLVEMPSIDRVKSEIQGSNPDDTLARQVAVFTYLPFIITRMQDPHRSVRAPNAPDEARIIGAYNLAAYQMSQAYAKSHTPEQAQAFEGLHGRYEMDGKFINQWLSALFSPEFRAAYDRAVAGQLAEYRAHVAQEQREFDTAKAQQEAAANQPTGSVRNDPGTLAVRRCLELGGNELSCVGKGLMTGLMDMTGINLDDITGPKQAGVVMNGAYNSGNSKLSLGFAAGTVSLSGCGNLESDGHAYTLTKKPNQLLINVKNEPSPFVLSLGNDGKLSGPGPTDVKGRIIIGYHNTWVEQRLVSDNSVVPGSGHWEREPIYAPKTERCTIGVLAPVPPPPADSAGGGLVGAVLSSFAQTGPTGLRMTGPYLGQGGLGLEFNSDSVILDCGAAHAKQPYAVENQPNQILITVKNGSTPFTLILQPNGTLVGSGSTGVAGRLVTGTSSDGVTYAPSNASCAIGSLAPKGGSGSTVGAASQPVSESPAAPATKNAVSAAPPASSGGDAALSVASGFPAGANPLAGKWVFLMKDRFDNVLRSIGAPLPPGTSPRQAWQTLTQRCRPPADCKNVYGAIATFFAAKMMMPGSGPALFSPNVPAGTYYVMSATSVNNSSVVWDVKVELKPGANSVVLDQRNSEPAD
jgi:choice-of-anchor C domain-containing protein